MLSDCLVDVDVVAELIVPAPVNSALFAALTVSKLTIRLRTNVAPAGTSTSASLRKVTGAKKRLRVRITVARRC